METVLVQRIWDKMGWDIVENVLPTSCYTGIHLAPLVMPNESAAFEEYAYNKFLVQLKYFLSHMHKMFYQLSYFW